MSISVFRKTQNIFIDMNNDVKFCTDCKKKLPLTEFYTTTSRKPNSRTYYSSRCKKCDVKSCKNRFSSSYKTRAITLFNGIRSRCRRRGIQCSISKDDIIRQYERQRGKCFYNITKYKFPNIPLIKQMLIFISYDVPLCRNKKVNALSLVI